MRRLLTAIALLSTPFSTGCARQGERLVEIPLPDPAARAGCPDAFPSPPVLAPLLPFALPDGRQVVLLATVQERDAATARLVIEARGAWHGCRSVKLYDDDWLARLSGSAK